MIDGRSDCNRWLWTTLGEAFKWGSGGTPTASNLAYYDGDIPWAVIGDLKDKHIDSTARTISLEGLSKSSAKWVEPDSVLVAMYGSIGKLAIARVRLTTNQAIAFAKPEVCSSKYLFYYLMAYREELVLLGKGGTQRNISQTVLKNFPFVYPTSFEVQRHVTNHLDLQLSRLDAAVAALKRAQANLKRYRASVLQAAVTGQLVPTEHELAQAEGRDYETGEQLLERILAERRRTWSGKGKYKEPITIDQASVELAELPVGWTWCNLDQLADGHPNAITDGPFGSRLKTEHYTAYGPRVIRLQNIGDGVFRDIESHISEEHYELLKRHHVNAGDIIIAGLGETLPRACRVPTDLGLAIVKADCIRFKPQHFLSSQFLMYALNSEPTRHRTTDLLHGVGRPRMNLTEIKSILLPIPPLSEQARIVEEVERRLSVADQMEATLEANLRRATRLRQAILKKAFTFHDAQRRDDLVHTELDEQYKAVSGTASRTARQ